MRKLLLINPGHLASPVWGWRSFPAHLHHMWSALIADGAIEVVDYNVEFGAPGPEARADFLGRLREDLSKREFDVAGISCWSSLNVTASHAVSRIIREIRPGVPIIVGGYHPSARPGDFPAELFDVVVRGCGIGVLRDAMRGERLDPGQMNKTGDSPQLARPRWNGFPYGVTGSAMGIYLSRGCPYRCSFCMETVMGRKWMALDPLESAEAVVEAINVTRTPFLQLYDPLFGLNPRWRRAFWDALLGMRKRFNKKTFIWAQIRSDSITPDDVKRMRKFRVQLAIGLEAASASILRVMNKSRNPERYLKKFAEMSDYLDREKTHHQAFLIFNHPGETPQTLDEARNWLLHLLAKKKKSYLTLLGQRYMYFPGSPLDEKWGELKEMHGTRVLHPSWWLEEDDHHDKAGAVIPSAALEKAGQLERWKDIMLEANARNLEVASKANRPDVETFGKQFSALNLQKTVDSRK